MESAPTDVTKATFSMACFWFPDALFGCTPGVIRTRVGYTGGTTPSPTYRNLGDHTETVEIEYDPKGTTYDTLLSLFWAHHDPVTPMTRQYRSVIFYHDDHQQKLAKESLQNEQKRIGKPVTTEILPAGQFYDAEEYHQKYRLKQHPWLVESLKLNLSQMTKSTLCGRLNGYVIGLGNLNAGWDQGLNEEQANYVRNIYTKTKKT